jgi:hypothetical protein
MKKIWLVAAASSVVLSSSLFADTIQGTGTAITMPTTATFTGSQVAYNGSASITTEPAIFWNNPAAVPATYLSQNEPANTTYANFGDVLAGLSTTSNLIGSNLVNGNVNGSYYAITSSSLCGSTNTTCDPTTGSTTTSTYSSTDATALEFSLVRSTTAETIATIFDSSSETPYTTFGYYLISGFTGAPNQFIPIYTGTGTLGSGANTNNGYESFVPGPAGTAYGFYATVCYSGLNTNCETYTTNNGNFGVNNGGAAWNHFAEETLGNGNIAIGFTDTNGFYANGIGTFANLVVELQFASSTPEPGTTAMLGLGLVALAFFGRRRLARS